MCILNISFMSSRGFVFYLIRTQRANSLASELCTCNYVHVSWWSLESTWVNYISELRIQFSKSWAGREMLFVHFVFKIAFCRGAWYKLRRIVSPLWEIRICPLQKPGKSYFASWRYNKSQFHFRFALPKSLTKLLPRHSLFTFYQRMAYRKW